MYKRRDWLFTHGADGGGDDTSSDSSSSSSEDGGSQDVSDQIPGDGTDNEEVSPETQPSSSEGEEEQKPGAQTTRPAKQQQAPLPSMRTRKSRKADRISEGSSEEESESEFEEEREIDSDNDAALYARRLEDLSEDDLDDGLEGVDEDGIDSDEEDEREQQLAMQLQSWAGAKAGTQGVKGKALKCVLCDGALVLNAVVLHKHMDSKKHKKQLDVVAKDGHTDLALHEVFCYAEDYDAAEKEEEQETYYERMQRVDEALAKAKSAAAVKAAEKEREAADGKIGEGKKAMKRRAKRMEKRKKTGKEVKKRPGKRQRQALKESGGGEAGKTGKKRNK
ncbi:hypothetical protein Ndes2526B_g06610 [Nannochloris sp. 'desiccata']|nr:hypothetical protein NADE_006462 [Chlorella desiccata (nom. nud.)]